MANCECHNQMVITLCVCEGMCQCPPCDLIHSLRPPGPQVVSDDLNTFAYDANVAGSDALENDDDEDDDVGDDDDDGDIVLAFFHFPFLLLLLHVLLLHVLLPRVLIAVLIFRSCCCQEVALTWPLCRPVVLSPGWAIPWNLRTTFRCPWGASMTSSQISWRLCPDWLRECWQLVN